MTERRLHFFWYVVRADLKQDHHRVNGRRSDRLVIGGDLVDAHVPAG